MPLVDGHVHLFPPSQEAARAAIAARDATFSEIYRDRSAKLATSGDLLTALDRAGVQAAVAAGFAFATAADVDAQNAYLAEAGVASDRIWPLATTNPALPGWEADLDRWLAAGARGVGELRPHNQGWHPLGPAGHALCELAAGRGVPLLWHVSEPVGHRYPGKDGGITPTELITLASEHPEVTMVAAHLGGGLSFYLQMPEVRSAIDSIYFDTAAVSLLYDMDSVARLVALAGSHRVIFGSDFPLLSPSRQLQQVQAMLSPGDTAAICGGNAAFLFGNRRL